MLVRPPIDQPYPYDDVAVGIWLHQAIQDSQNELDRVLVIHDPEAFHDAPGKGGNAKAIDDNTIVLHHLSPDDMRKQIWLPSSMTFK